MSKCRKCQSALFLDENLCKEHYYELYNIPPDFHKYKEKQWRDFLTYSLSYEWNIHVKFNRQLPGTTVIPDLHFVFLDVLFMIEIDEHHHKGGLNYTSEREEARYNQLGGYDEVIVLRINPDGTKKLTPVFKKILEIESPGNVTEKILVDTDEFDRRKGEVMQCLNELLQITVENWKKEKGVFSKYFSFEEKTCIKIYNLFFD